jgi:hypothetical protein
MVLPLGSHKEKRLRSGNKSTSPFFVGEWSLVRVYPSDLFLLLIISNVLAGSGKDFYSYVSLQLSHW